MAAAAGNKTVRFTQVVKRSGDPQVHTLWVAPEKDPELQRAQKANRVMTIQASQRGGKTDVGVVGFDPKAGHGGQFLIFPKSLKPFAGARVVGIKFDLVEQPKLSPAKVEKSFVAPAAVKAWSGKSKKEARPPKPADRERPSHDKGKHAAIVAFAPPAEQKKPSVAQPPPPAKKTNLPPATPPYEKVSVDVLVREIRLALRELKAGKAVAAYQRLERAIEK